MWVLLVICLAILWLSWNRPVATTAWISFIKMATYSLSVLPSIMYHKTVLYTLICISYIGISISVSGQCEYLQFLLIIPILNEVLLMLHVFLTQLTKYSIPASSRRPRDVSHFKLHLNLAQCYCKLLQSNCVLYVQEELLKKLIKGKDEDSFHRHLSGLDELLQDDEMKELLDGSLAYAAYLDSNLQWRHLFRRVQVRNTEVGKE